MSSQVGHENSRKDVEAQLMQLSQVQLAHIVSSAVSQALIRQMQEIVQPVQAPIQFDVPTFEGDSAASWLTWSQRVVYQAKA